MNNMPDLLPVVFHSFGGWSYAQMWHEGSPPPLHPNRQLQPVIQRADKSEKILETAHDDPFSRNTSEKLTSALSPAVRNVAAKCYTVVEL